MSLQAFYQEVLSWKRDQEHLGPRRQLQSDEVQDAGEQVNGWEVRWPVVDVENLTEAMLLGLSDGNQARGEADA